MAYQAKIIKKRFVTYLYRIFLVFSHSYQDVVIDRLSWSIEWVYLMAYQAKLIEEDSWRIFAERFHCIHIRIKMWWLIDSHGGSNEFIWWLIKQTYWRKFMMHLCRTFPLYPHLYQDVMINRLSWRIEWVYLVAYQANSLKKVRDTSLQNLFIIFTFISKCGN